MDAAPGVDGAAVHPGGPHVQEDLRNLHAAPPEALLRADGAPRGIQVRRQGVRLVLHNVAVVEPKRWRPVQLMVHVADKPAQADSL